MRPDPRSWPPEVVKQKSKHRYGIRSLCLITKESEISSICCNWSFKAFNPLISSWLISLKKKNSLQPKSDIFTSGMRIQKIKLLDWTETVAPKLADNTDFLKCNLTGSSLGRNEPATKFGKGALEDTERLGFLCGSPSRNQTKEFLKGCRHFFLASPPPPNSHSRQEQV